MADDDADVESFAAKAKQEADEAEKQELYRQRRSTVLDTLLRKIHRCGGVDRLTRDERAFLDRASKELAHELGHEVGAWDPPAEQPD